MDACGYKYNIPYSIQDFFVASPIYTYLFDKLTEISTKKKKEEIKQKVTKHDV